jgi:glycosyltransferase involved in cell wall biosynthesis
VAPLANASITPRVTVLLPVHNGAEYLRESIHSVLTQTFTSFELLIVDDGSTDATPTIIESFDEPRLVVVRNDTALGVARSLNRGLHAARGEYIARLDADDLCQSKRLATQIAFFERAPDAGALGTGYVKIDSAGRSLGPRGAPTDPIDVRWRLLFHNPLVHSTMMIRKSAFDALGGFFESESGEDPRSRFAEDYEMWCRIAKRMPIGTLQDALVLKRMHQASINHTSSSRSKFQVAVDYTREVAATVPLPGEDYDQDFVIDALSLLYRPEERLDDERARAVAGRILRLHDAFCRYYQVAAEEERRRARRLRALLRRRLLDMASLRLREASPLSALRAAGAAVRL